MDTLYKGDNDDDDDDDDDNNNNNNPAGLWDHSLGNNCLSDFGDSFLSGAILLSSTS